MKLLGRRRDQDDELHKLERGEGRTKWEQKEIFGRNGGDGRGTYIIGGVDADALRKTRILNSAQENIITKYQEIDGWWKVHSAKNMIIGPAEHSRFSIFSWEAERRCVRWVLMRNADETASVEISEYARAGEITFLTASMISLGSPRQHAKCRSVLTPTWAKDDMFVDVTGGAWFIFEDLKIKKEGK